MTGEPHPLATSEVPEQGRYSRLPDPVDPALLRTSQNVVPYPEPVGEADRERDFLLRTAGVF